MKSRVASSQFMISFSTLFDYLLQCDALKDTQYVNFAVWLTLLNNAATPECSQPFPSIGITWPRISDIVMVPSMSETTILSVSSQRNMWHVHRVVPWKHGVQCLNVEYTSNFICVLTIHLTCCFRENLHHSHLWLKTQLFTMSLTRTHSNATSSLDHRPRIFEWRGSH